MVGTNPSLHGIVKDALNKPSVNDEVCGCGKPCRYQSVADGRSACNKYFRCPTYDELVQENIRLNRELSRLKDSQAMAINAGF